MYPDPRAPQPYPYPVIVAPPPTSGLATAALVLGIFSIMGGFCLVVPPFLAVWLGHGATRETRTGQRGGHGMAIAGLIMGYVGVVFWVAWAIMWGLALINAGATGVI